MTSIIQWITSLFSRQSSPESVPEPPPEPVQEPPPEPVQETPPEPVQEAPPESDDAPPVPAPDPLRARRRLAEEWLLASGRWRDDLADEQAQRLLDWGRGMVNGIVEETAVLSDDAAEEAIDQGVTAVLRVMQAVNDITPLLAKLDEQSARRQLAQFNQKVTAVTGRPIPDEKIEQIIHSPGAKDAPSLFDALLKLLTEDGAGEEE
jgi:hypothetical protein